MMRMVAAIRCGLEAECKQEQRLSLDKKCPDCGHMNNLSTALQFEDGTNLRVLPCCSKCKAFLWKELRYWKEWVKRREPVLDLR